MTSIRSKLTACAPFAVACAVALATAACGRPFDVKTGAGFVELRDQDAYAYRATSPEGVVTAVRVVDDEERGDLAFWTHAITQKLREGSGYAFEGASDVTSQDGTKGKMLRFGRDQDGKPFVYWVAIYPAQDRLFLVEAGGAKEPFERARGSVEASLKSVRVRCESALAPVLASRTCNRW
jgi:hypothetical protein